MGSAFFGTDADIYYLRQSVKNIPCTQAQGEMIPSTVFQWRTLRYMVDALRAIGFVVCGVFLVQNVMACKKSKKEKPVAAADKPDGET